MIKNVILPFVVDNSITDDVKWFVENNKKNWIYNTEGNTKNRFYCILSKLNTPFSLKINKLRNKLFNQIGVEDLINEHYFGNFVGVNKSGGNVQFHTDPQFNDRLHVRINILIQKPLEGGMPIIDGHEYIINERECWFNNASCWLHGSTVVQGSRDRIVLSLGAYILPEDFSRVNTVILKN